MPIYEYVCDDCGTRYEQIVLSQSQSISCPKCSSARATIQLSVFSTPGKSSASANGKELPGLACACTPNGCGCN